MEAPKLMERANRLFGKTRGFAHKRAAQFKQRAAHLKAAVHEKPFTFALLGLGAGFLLGMLLMPRVPKVQLEIRTNGKAT